MTDSRDTAPYGTTYHPGRPTDNGRVTAFAPAPPARLPRQRRPVMIALAVVLIGAGILATASIYSHLNHQQGVLVVSAAVPVGAIITGSDIGTANVEAGPGVQVIPARQLSQVVGLIAATALRPGMLLSSSEITVSSPPAAGQELIALAVHPSALPASGLAPGDKVLITPTPGIPGSPGTAASGTAVLTAPVPATIESVATAVNQDGLDVVDVLVTITAGPSVAAQASTGQVAIIVTHRSPR